ncbi:hypothetical protein [Paenarthrobacter sp. NCHU4564]|uniref:hypothetical protein n=1 Tax=Paenarthrobacter sp. NCHU4564 TaxID=3451353 RepID=UPI003F96D7E0
MKRTVRSMILMLATALASTVVVTASSAEERDRPSDRMVNLGFEDIVGTAPEYLDSLAARLDAVDATAVSISVGRTDWTAFPWPGDLGAASSSVADTGRDYVAEAMAALGTAGDGTKRDVVLTVDVLLDRALQETPSLAGRDVTGTNSTAFASVSALRHGGAGTRLVRLAAFVAERYRPDAVDLTELMFDGFTFGSEDLRDFTATTGQQDWPRKSNGAIDQTNPYIKTWRSEAVADIVRKVAAAVAPFGVRAEMDVRSPKKSATGDRADSGHDYDLLLKQLDRLHVWQYVGLNDERAPRTEELARAMNRRAGPRMSLSLGLWSQDGIISAETFAAALEDAVRGGATSVSVTPASLMTEDHWDVLEAAWADQGSPP